MLWRRFDFAGDTMVKTLSFHHRGHGFDPWSIHAEWPHTKLNEMCVRACVNIFAKVVQKGWTVT